MKKMILKKALPSNALRQFVHYYGWFEVQKSNLINLHHFFPSFATGLIFIFNQGGKIVSVNEKIGRVELDQILLFPPITRYTENLVVNKLTIFWAVFQPGGLHHTFGIHLDKFKDKVVNAAKDVSYSLNNIYERMDSDQSFEKCMVKFEKFLIDHLTSLNTQSEPKLFHILNAALNKIGYNKKATEISRALGIGARQLNRRLNKELGISFKQFVQIHRLSKVLTYMNRELEVCLPKIAYEFGYFDQPHLNYELRKMTGRSPLKLIQDKQLRTYHGQMNYSFP